jgi:molybdate transport system substrate-binding protein
VLLALAFIYPLCAAQEITVAAAADLQFALQDLAARFQKESGSSCMVRRAISSSRLKTVLPLTCSFPRTWNTRRDLKQLGVTEPGTYYQYARGKLVIWVPKDSRLNLGSGVAVLLDPSIKKIAIANPEHAPYGQAAVAVLRSERVYDRVKDELVFGENASQAASFATSGAADAASRPCRLPCLPR